MRELSPEPLGRSRWAGAVGAGPEPSDTKERGHEKAGGSHSQARTTG